MSNAQAIELIKKSSLAERLEVIEILLQSIRTEIQVEKREEKAPHKKFKIREFDLGAESTFDRDELYGERGQ